MAQLASLRLGAALVAAIGFFACSAADTPTSAPASGETPTPADPTPGPAGDASDDSVVVAHDRELRGAWISTVYNGVWPSETGLSMDAAKAELVGIFDALAGAHMNAVFFQVRSESDAVYASSLEPWSRFLTGTQGQDPGWDPLAFAVEEGHKRGLEVHAWLNPYRGLVSKQIAVAPNHITKTLASAARNYGTQVWMDPGVAEVREHIVAVVKDIVTRYDVDGIHFDDYFYPYPVAGATFDDSAPYAAYESGGGSLGKDDWRRSNVDALVHETADAVASARASVRFGVSPFGIYRPGSPAGVTGLDAYATLYCDPVKWMDQGWVDYLAPQLYWPTTSTGQPFGKLVEWWAGLAKSGRSVFVGHDATNAGDGTWTLDEYDAEMKLVAAQRARGALGSIFFSAKPLVADQAGLRTALGTKYWATPAATPPLSTAASEPAGPPPRLEASAGGIVVSVPAGTRAAALYQKRADGVFAIVRLVGVASTSATDVTVPLGEKGDFAVSVIDRRGVESRAAPLSGATP